MTLKFYTAGNTKCSSQGLNRTATADDSPGALLDANPAPSQAKAATAGALPMAAPPSGALPPAAPSPRRVVRKRVSDPPTPKEEPAAKRRRLHRETLKELRDNITSAANNDNWCRSSDWDHNSVVYLTDELLQVLRGVSVLRIWHRTFPDGMGWNW